jgi:hypothetical protein
VKHARLHSQQIYYDPLYSLRSTVRTVIFRRVGVKLLATLLALASSSIFSLFITCQSIPEPLRKSRIVLLPRTSHPSSPNEFRPIAIHSVLTKCLKKCLLPKLVTLRQIIYFQSNSLVSEKIILRQMCLSQSLTSIMRLCTIIRYVFSFLFILKRHLTRWTERCVLRS